LSPLNIMKKGYTLCWNADEALVTRIQGIKKDDQVSVSFHQGEFSCRVTALDRAKTVESRLRKGIPSRSRRGE